jgi:hypothetical protein
MTPNLPLRDIHLPDPVAWLPPAPGWWLLAFAAFALPPSLIWLWRLARRTTAKKLALRELERIAGAEWDANRKLQELAILLRRVCLGLYPREETAGLVGEAWLEFLDRSSNGDGFSRGVGRLLIDGPYRRRVEADLNSVFDLCRDWIEHLPKIGSAPTSSTKS